MSNEQATAPYHTVAGITIFNTSFQIMRADGTAVILDNIFQKRLLDVLAAEPSRVFTKDELLDALSFGKDTDRLDAVAKVLRQKLDPETPGYIANIWGVGYRFVA